MLIAFLDGANGVPYVYIEYMNTTDIPANATSVEFKDFSMEVIETGAFSHLSVCGSLVFNNTNISMIQVDAWEGLQSLTSLTICQNELKTLTDDTFQHLLSLQNLTLNQNKIMTIESDTFSGLSSLTTLKIRGNDELVDLQFDVFKGLSSLQELDLSDNGLNALPSGLFHGLDITILILNGNKLTTISCDIFNPMDFRSNGGHPSKCFSADYFGEKLELKVVHLDVFEKNIAIYSLSILNNAYMINMLTYEFSTRNLRFSLVNNKCHFTRYTSDCNKYSH